MAKRKKSIALEAELALHRTGSRTSHDESSPRSGVIAFAGRFLGTNWRDEREEEEEERVPQQKRPHGKSEHKWQE